MPTTNPTPVSVYRPGDDFPGSSELDVIRVMAADLDALAASVEKAGTIADRQAAAEQFAGVLSEMAARARWLSSAVAAGVDLPGLYADDGDFATEHPEMGDDPAC